MGNGLMCCRGPALIRWRVHNEKRILGEELWKKVYLFFRASGTYTALSAFQAHTCYLSIQWLRATLAVLRGLSLQHDCNTHCNTATQRCFFTIQSVFFALAKASSLSKRFETFNHGAGQVYPVNYSVAWLCCSACCSRVFVKIHATQPHRHSPGTKAFGALSH